MRVINFEFPGLDDVPQIFYFGRKELAFLYFERDTHMYQTCQYIVDVVDTVFDSVRVDDSIFEADKARFSLLLSEYDVEGSLKRRRSVFRPMSMRIYWQVPKCPTNAFFSRSSSQICICEYPEYVSVVENIFTCPGKSIQSSMRGRG